jgi:hypothetical protein
MAYYIVAGLVAASLVQVACESLNTNRRSDTRTYNRGYIPRSKRTHIHRLSTVMNTRLHTIAQHTAMLLVLAPIEGFLRIVGAPQRPRSFTSKKARRHTPKQLFRGRVRRNDKIRTSVKKLRKLTHQKVRDKFLRMLLRQIRVTSPNIIHVAQVTPQSESDSETNTSGQNGTQGSFNKIRGNRWHKNKMITSTKQCRAKFQTVAHTANQQYHTNKKEHIDFGTDSFLIKVDNCASSTMSYCRNDFIQSSMRKATQRGVKGFGKTVTPITHIGTIRWQIYDDEGRHHQIEILNSYYVPGGSARLLSPQHWLQQAGDTYPIRHGTWCATYDDSIICYWGQQKYQLTIPLDPGSNNIATIHTASGFDIAMNSVDQRWQEAQDIAFKSLVSIPEIIPDLYPKGSDDHGLPIETTYPNIPHVNPIDEDLPHGEE